MAFKNTRAAIKPPSHIWERKQQQRWSSENQSVLVGQAAPVTLFLEHHKVIGSPTVEVEQT